MNERNTIFGLHRDGTLLPLEIAISKINVNGQLEFTAIIRDITDRISLMGMLQNEAATDELTGPTKSQNIYGYRSESLSIKRRGLSFHA
jgi:hypothetical protein